MDAQRPEGPRISTLTFRRWLGDSGSEKGESWLDSLRPEGPGISTLTCCRWLGDSRSENGELAGFSKARRARDIHPYLLPVVGRQQI